MIRMVRRAERYLRRKLSHGSRAREILRNAKQQFDLLTHDAAEHFPAIIRPNTKRVYVSLTADCNLRCAACNYGRDFMPQHQLPWNVGEPLLADIAAAGIPAVRLYGGEPLLHRDINLYVERSVQLGLDVYVTTNGLLLDKKIDALAERGLKRVSIGLYGIGVTYDDYVDRRGAFAAMSRSVRRTRERHSRSTMRMHFDWLLMRPTSDLDTVRRTLDFARDLEMGVYVNLIHYSLPYFMQGTDNMAYQFYEADRDHLYRVVDLLLDYRTAHPDVVLNSEPGLRSIPDWLILGPAMRVPCNERELIWIGADGTVQMCYVTFRLGNLHETRLSEMLFKKAHREAALDAFKLKCPNCHCRYDERILSHRASRNAYAS